jgi:hypothetical protein
MATLLNMLDDLRDLLDDASDVKYSVPTKTRWINHGQAAMWPNVYQIVRDETLTLATDDYEYTIPSNVGTESILIGVEIEVDTSPGRWAKLDGRQYDIVPHLATQLLILHGSNLPGTAGNNIRITAATPLTALAASSDTYSGPAVTVELPIMYAMHKAMARDIEGRLQWSRFSTTQGLNGTNPEQFIMTSEKWYNMFLSSLERLKMPIPGM